MIEAGAYELTNEEMLTAIKTAHVEIKKVCEFIQTMKDEIGKPKFEYKSFAVNEEVYNVIAEEFGERMKQDVQTPDKPERDEKIDKMDKKIDKLLDSQKCLDSRLTSVEDNVLENEADRLRSELFDCGNRCRRGIRLHPEEMEHIRAIYHKYKNVLHQNHEGDAEFDFINQYYNQQSFPAYHTPTGAYSRCN